jgi:hypothetical protein
MKMTNNNEAIPDQEGPFGTYKNGSYSNVGMIGISRVSTSMREQLVGAAGMGRELVALRISHGEVYSDSYTKEGFRAKDQIVEVYMSPLQWGQFVSSFGVGDGVPCTINRLDGKMVEQEYISPSISDHYEEKTKVKLQTIRKKYASAFSEAKEILENKKTISKSDRDKIMSAYRSLDRFLFDDLPFMEKMMVEDTTEHINKAEAQFKYEMERLIERHGLENSDVKKLKE